jgi:hypothetical protein
MCSQIKDNRLAVSLDLSELYQIINRLDPPSALMLRPVELAAKPVYNLEVFSTLAKKALITAGSLNINNVVTGFEVFLEGALSAGEVLPERAQRTLGDL